MPGLSDIAGLPEAYASIVRSIGRTNRGLALAARQRNRQLPVTLRHFQTIRTAAVRTKVFIQKIGQEVVFFFIKGPATQNVILDLSIDFDVIPAVGSAPPMPPPPASASVHMPSFLVDSPSPAECTVLAKELGEREKNVVFLKLGLFRMGITSPEDPTNARVAWMLHDTAKADIVYTRLAFDPVPFLILLRAIEDWARADFQGEAIIPVSGAGTKPLARIIRAMLDGWTAASQSAVDTSTADPFDLLRPPLDLHGYRGAVTLRLTPKGEIAERIRDDDFRLRVSLAISPPGAAALTVLPPDFLTSGPLHKAMLDAILQEPLVNRLFTDSGLKKTDRPDFDQHLQTSASSALVFRARKDGDRDFELLSFRGDFKGNQRTTIVAATFRVKNATADPEVTLVDEPQAQPKLAFCDLSKSNPPRPSAEFPLYLLRLVAQLNNWRASLE
jgi:hypothetical protein